MNFSTDSFESSFNDLKSVTSNKRLSRVVAMDFEENDDTQEKKSRKRDSVMLQLALSTNNKSKDNVKSKILNSEQISHHYGDCMKLASENKITSKNAFDLHLIDYLQDYMHSLQSFQVVSSSLDAGAKIYAGRVDLVHSSTYHILTSCGSTPEGDMPEEPPSELNDDTEDTRDEIKNKRKKRPEHNKKTTCTNIRKIRLTAAQIRSEADPLFQSQAKKFDEGGTGELRLNHLKLLDDNYGLLLDFDSIITTKCGDYVDSDNSEVMLDISEFAQILQDLAQKPVQISSEFDHFKFVGWDPATETINPEAAQSFTNITHNERSMMDDYDDDGGYDDYNGPNHTINNEENIKIEGNGDVVMTSAVLEEEEADDHMLTIGNSKFENGSSLFVSSVKEMVNSFMDNYGEINDNILGMWAGPDHWKIKAKPIKFIQPNDDRPRTTKTPKVKKEIAPIFPDWVNTRLDDNGIGRLVDIRYEDVEARDPKVSTQLTDVCLNKNIQKEYILPPRTQFAFKSINQLMNREVSLVNKALKMHAEQMSAVDLADEQNAEKNNANDLFETVPENMIVIDDDGNLSHHTDDYGGGGGDYYDDDDPYTGNSLRNCNFDDFGENNQVSDNVRRTETVDLNYAKTAKRINVKKLKLEIMSYLTEKIHLTDMATVAGKQYPDVHMSSRLCTLSKLLISVDKNVSSDVSKELSVSILMTCLLHLANEMGLDIVSKDDYSDFNLGQGFSEYDLEQIAVFGVARDLSKDSRKRRTMTDNDDDINQSKRRQSLFSIDSDDSD